MVQYLIASFKYKAEVPTMLTGKRFLKPDNMPLVIWISLTQFVSEPLSDQHDTFKKESVKKMYQYFNKPPTSILDISRF